VTLHALAVPKWGLAMEEGTLTGWLVSEGDRVSVGQEVAEIETSKIANVLEAQNSGVLRRRVADEGDVRAVGALLGVLSDADEADAEVDAFVADYAARFATEVASAVAAPVAETIEVGGRTIRYLKAPATSEAPHAPLVLIHGFGGDHLNWMFNQGALSADRDVYAIDLAGHGGSTKDVGDGGLDTLAADVAAWLDAIGAPAAHLVGHSMGAGVALSLALAHPRRVLSLTGVCGAGFGGVLNRDYVEGFLAARKARDLKPVVELLFADPGLATREMLGDLIASTRIDGVPAALRLLIDNALAADGLVALRDRLGEVTVPVLSIFGAADRVMSTPTVDSLPGEVLIVEGAGHMPHLEAAAAVNARIAAFIGGHD
jgi:pyruvate dehydrogenase E2 component (dihydrolipoamide acetyltransferase)